MTAIPEGAATVSGEGADVASAISAAASELGVDANRVRYNLDMAHFRSQAGGVVARRTVKIIAWAVDEAEAAAEEPKRKRRSRKDRDGGESAEAPASSSSSSSDLGETEASKFAQVWFSRLIELMGVTGTVTAAGDAERVRLTVDVDKAGRIIGRRGATLDAIRYLLRRALAEHGDLIIDVDIPDKRDDRGGRSERSERSERSDRGERRSRRDDDRRGRRDDDRRSRRRRDRDDDEGGDRYPADKLRALARRAAQKAAETGKTITVQLKLNSFDRRIVHMEVAEIDGVASRSEVRDGVKYVQVIPDDEG